jgi:hypothetical protein
VSALGRELTKFISLSGRHFFRFDLAATLGW